MSQTAAKSFNAEIHPRRLFSASCMSLIVTAVVFAMLASTMGALKQQFILDNEQVGWIVGAGTWGFTVSILVLGPLCDALGIRRLMRFAFLCHFAGVLLMVLTPYLAAPGSASFWMLFFGALVASLGNGTVEAACNPLIATLFPREKTRKLNRFHMWFPGGIVMGGLICFGLDKLIGKPLAGLAVWQIKFIIILIPTLIYGVMFTGQKFPLTERVQAGISFRGMVKETLFRPLFLVLFVCMMITASLELGPQRWIPSVLEAGGIDGILVLVWITGLMAVLRYFAGPIVHRLSNTGVLLASAVLAGLGLLLLSFASGGNVVLAGVAATVFALGVCYFWPTMLGTAAERVPKGGALALAMLGGVGMLVVGVVTTPLMGRVADRYLHKKLQPAETAQVLQQAVTAYGELAKQQPPKIAKDTQAASEKAAEVIAAWHATGNLPETKTANALREAAKILPEKSETAKAAKKILNPADNYGGLMSFRYVCPLSLVLIVVFGVMYLQDRRRGGYKPEQIVKQGARKDLAAEDSSGTESPRVGKTV